MRQRIVERQHGGGKCLLEVPGYKFQALRTNLPCSFDAVTVWRRYNGRADIENRIKELGSQFGLKSLCCRSFWATEAACHLAICAYNLCVCLQRRLECGSRAELINLHWRLFCCAAVFSHAQGRATLKLAVSSQRARTWWITLLQRFTHPHRHCDAVDGLQARSTRYRFARSPPSA